MAATPEGAKKVLEKFLELTAKDEHVNWYGLAYHFMDNGRDEFYQALRTAIECLGDWRPADEAERIEFEYMQRLEAEFK